MRKTTFLFKNDVARLVSTVLSFILQITFFLLLMVTSLRTYALLAETIARLVAFVLVLGIYSQYRASALKTSWIILLLLMPIFGILMYLLFGLTYTTNGKRLRYERVDEALRLFLQQDERVTDEMQDKIPSVRGVSHYLQETAGFPVYQNTSVTYYAEAADALEAQLDAISKARQFIFMEYFAIEDAESWQRMQQILEEKAAAGVEVRLFYDDIGSLWFTDRGFAKRLREKGIHCKVFNVVNPFWNVFMNNRDHRKITVVDGVVGFTGGYNIANEYFNLTHRFGHWKDTGVRLEGDAVASLTASFLEMWHSEKKQADLSAETELAPYFLKPAVSCKTNGFVQPYADMPLDNEQVGENVYISLANRAEHYLYFITPYLIITDEMNQALGLAAKRGVDVRIITPGIPDKKLIYQITRSYYGGLARNGVRIFEYTPGFCHAKMSVSDDLVATCGTINLDYRSFYHHFENGCLIFGQDDVRAIKTDFDTMLEESCEVTELYATGRRRYLRFGQMILRLFAPLL